MGGALTGVELGVDDVLGAYGAAGIGKDLGAVVAEADGAAEAKRSQVAAF